MPNYTISITDNEKKCLDTVMVGIGTWAANSLQNRAHRAQEKILNDLYKHCNENGIAIGVLVLTIIGFVILLLYLWCLTSLIILYKWP